ncbi:LCP family protein [Radiobacillus sp. PE A8.2]|uniref:LCP family glycopolymer transferase n=1 Tax=Radiobacillus sp. PE A8.2 TaxID=3380349 RepID=UPI00388DB709
MKKLIKNKVFQVLMAVIFVAGLSIGVYSISIYQNAAKTVNEKIYQPVQTIEHDFVKKKIKEEKPLNILLLGVDERKGDVGRSDALMVLALSPSEDNAKLISIPRDTRTEIIGRGTLDKINHAYAFGGPDMSIQTVEHLLDIQLDYFVRVNMEGLAEVVDAIGGITVNNDIKFNNFDTGEVYLSGTETLEYVRMRKQDPNGDFGRTERQRKVIQEIINQGANISSVTKIHELIDVLGNNVATNMDFEDMKNLLFNYKNTRNNLTTYQLQGKGTMINGIWYMNVTEEEVEKVHNMIVES